MKSLFLATTAAGILLATAANPMVGGAPMMEDKNIVQNAVNSKDHTTLVAAVKAAGLVDTLEGKGPASRHATGGDLPCDSSTSI